MTHKIPTKNHFGLTEYHHEKKNLDLRNTYENKISDPKNIHEKIFRTRETLTEGRRQLETRPTRATIAHDLRNLTPYNLHTK